MSWEEIKHIVISLINDFYSQGNEFVIDKSLDENNVNLKEIEKIVKILDQKIRPAVARDGGDIKFKDFNDGIVRVQLQGSCSGLSQFNNDFKARCSKFTMPLYP